MTNSCIWVVALMITAVYVDRPQYCITNICHWRLNYSSVVPDSHSRLRREGPPISLDMDIITASRHIYVLGVTLSGDLSFYSWETAVAKVTSQLWSSSSSMIPVLLQHSCRFLWHLVLTTVTHDRVTNRYNRQCKDWWMQLVMLLATQGSLIVACHNWCMASFIGLMSLLEYTASLPHWHTDAYMVLYHSTWLTLSLVQCHRSTTSLVCSATRTSSTVVLHCCRHGTHACKNTINKFLPFSTFN